MSSTPEILVHISAPSRASDDARYRRELQSLLHFQPAHRHVLTPSDPHPGLDSEYGDALEQVADATFTSSSNPAPCPPGSILKASRSKLVTPASAAFEGCIWGKTPALVPGTTSHPNVDRTRPLAFPPLRPRTAPAGSSGSQGVQETPPLPRAQSDSWQTPPSVIPDSQPTPYLPKRPALYTSSPSPTRTSSPATRRKRPRLDNTEPTLPIAQYIPHDGNPASETQIPSSIPQPPPHTSSYAASAEPSSSPIPSSPPTTPFTFTPHSTTIHPPRAPISTAHFTTHTTPFLRTLTTRLPLSKVYTSQIIAQTRPLAVSERGHWRVDMTSFSEEVKAKFWAFLEEIVGKGQVGWGVWCVLDDEGEDEVQECQDPREREGVRHREEKAGAAEQEGSASPTANRTIAKILCWGEIAGEIWNVLFIGLHRQVVGTGVCWVDAEGKVVVRMK